MKKFAYIIPLLLIALFLLLLTLPDREERALSKYDEANRIEQTGQVRTAEELYREIVSDYPGTPAAGQAEERLAAIRKERERKLLKAALPVLDSIRQVIDGYVSLFGEPPRSAADLDREDFLFDADYLGTGVPEGVTAYLALGEGVPGYRIWSIKDGTEVAFTIDGTGEGLRKETRVEMLREIRDRFREEARRGRMIFLKSAAPVG